MERIQNPSLKNAVYQTAKPAVLALTGSKDETSVSDKLHDHSDYVFIQHKSQQLAGKITVQTVSYATDKSTNWQQKSKIFSVNRMT